MTVRLLDTNIVSFALKQHPLSRRCARHVVGYSLAVSFMTVAELYHGALRASWGPGRIARMRTLLSKYAVLGVDEALCRTWGEVCHLRRHQPIDGADAWIAATALAHNLELVTHNPADFHSLPGLSVITEAP